MRDHEPGATKQKLLTSLRMLAAAPVERLHAAAAVIFAPDTAYLCSHPVNQLHGLDQLVATHLAPLKHAFPDLERRDDIVMSGRYADSDWVSATGYYYGTFEREWLGLPPSRNWTYLRFGEFYKLVDGMIVDSYVILDVVDVLRQIGRKPLPPALGVEGLCPPPAAQDGLLLETHDASESAKSLALVEAMIFQGMWGFDGIDHDTMNFGRYFTQDMMWYGPAGIGTTRGIDGFMARHEIPFNEAWPDFKGGDHKARFGDGSFICSTGWPSIRGTHTGSGWLGLDATNLPFTMRVMDWWKREGDWLVENWIFIDMLHLFLQFGRDLLAEARAMNPPD